MAPQSRRALERRSLRTALRRSSRGLPTSTYAQICSACQGIGQPLRCAIELPMRRTAWRPLTPPVRRSCRLLHIPGVFPSDAADKEGDIGLADGEVASDADLRFATA